MSCAMGTRSRLRLQNLAQRPQQLCDAPRLGWTTAQVMGRITARDLGNLAQHRARAQQSLDRLPQLDLQLEVIRVEREGGPREEAEQEHPARTLMVRRAPLVHGATKISA